jgi:thymidylate synthase ThyX
MTSYKILIKDDLHPEDNAMLQALYSRSPKSVTAHLTKVEEAGSGSFMDDYYVGYGHASIGDCGSTTLFIEGVSMLMAKAIQDHPMYSGQEASTRYMNWTKAQFETPGWTPSWKGSDGHVIQRTWIEFYNEAFPQLLEHFRRLSPINGDDPAKYERALKARVFDVLRAFIPAGAHTNLSWHTNLRQAHDKLRTLLVHPDPDIANLAYDICKQLQIKYPHSGFDFPKMGPREWGYLREVAKESTFAPMPKSVGAVPYLGFEDFHWRPTGRLEELVANRPRGMYLPASTIRYGTITSTFMLDFGSFRDVQRHRNGYMQMPLLTTGYGFHPWYLQQLPPWLRDKAELLIERQTKDINELDITDVARQSYIAMGFQVFCKMQQTLPAFVYRLELRTSKSVHPTLRQVVQEEVRMFQRTYEDILIHADMSPDEWDLRRGSQTILEKGEK